MVIVACSPAPEKQNQVDDTAAFSSAGSREGSSGLGPEAKSSGTSGSPAGESSSGGVLKYNVGGGSGPAPRPCDGQPAGLVCNDSTAITCDGADNVVSMQHCPPQVASKGPVALSVSRGSFPARDRG